MAEKRPGGPASPSQEPSFEEALERLETIVEDLEGGALTLEESIARYEEGVRLSKRLTQTLDEAEKRIERLVQSEEGAPATTPMEIDEGNGGGFESPARQAPSGERAPGGQATPGGDPGIAPRPERGGPPSTREERADPARREREGDAPPREARATPRMPPDELPF